jgi:iron complex transport system permease protein
MSIVSVLPIDILKRFIIARYVLIALLVIFAIFSLVTGPMNLSSSEGILTLFDSLLGTQYNTLEQYQQVVIMELRLPRLLLAVMVGAMLAQCGAVMQGLFRNPLADPGIVGVSSGASVGAVLAICLFPVSISVWSIPLFAFLGGLVTTLLVYRLAKSSEGTSVLMLLLAGVAISAFSGALIGFISYFADDQKLRALSLWQMGSLAGANSEYLWLSFITMLTLFWAFQRQANALNALLLGEAEARHLGISVEAMKLKLIVLVAIGVGVAVASSGMIGFIGLVIPHLVRMSLGPNHTTLLPLSALCGALLLLLSDLLARTLVQPAELPVGLITALLGAPFFLALLLQFRRKGGL